MAGVPEMLGDLRAGDTGSQLPSIESHASAVVESGGTTLFLAKPFATNLYVYANAGGPATLLATDAAQLQRADDGMVYLTGTSTPQISGILRIDPATLSITKLAPANVGEIAVLGNSVYGFAPVRHPVTNVNLGTDLAILNQATGQWELVTEVRSGTSSPISDIVAISDSRILFFADDGVHGRELWVTDGTAAGTRLTADLVPSGKFHYPLAHFAAGDTFYWTMQPNPGFEQIWRFGPADASPVLLAEYMDVHTTTFAAYGDDLIYATQDHNVHHRVWRASATSSTPSLLAGGIYSYDHKPIGVHDGHIYFNGSDPAIGPYRHHLWKSDGTPEGTAPFFTFAYELGNYSGFFTSAHGYLYFHGDNDDWAFGATTPRYGRELWRTDGTAAGTELVADLWAGQDSSTPRMLTNAGDNLFFFADDGVHGPEPWVLRAAKDLRAGELKITAPETTLEIDWGSEITAEFLVGYFAPAGQSSSETTAHLVLSTTPDIAVGQPIIATVTVTSVAAGTSKPVEVTFTLPAAAPPGFEAARKLYAGLIIDAGNVLEEANEANNWNQGLGIDIVALREPPQVVHVLTHGFNPNPLGGWESFRSAWKTTYPTAVRELAEQTPYAGKTVEYVAEWNSSDGWLQAFAGAITWALLQSPHPIARAIPKVVQTVVEVQIELALMRGAYQAEMAAHRIVADLLSGDYLGPPDENQIIHLIGHSRGAAVNARVLQLLAQQGYSVAQFTSLDGFSSDWPLGASILADFEIQKLALGAQRRLNFTVEDGLGVAAFDYFLDALVSEQLSIALGRTIDLDLPEWAEPLLGNWRAPARVGFENVLIEAQGAFENSHHTNVSALYFGSGEDPAPLDYLRLSPLFAAPQQFAALDDGAGEGLPLQHSSAGDFIDGSMQWLAGLTAQVAGLGTVVSEEPLFALMVEALRKPEYLLSLVWQTLGDVKLVVEGGDGSLELRQSADTRIGQTLLVDHAAESLVFDLEVVAAGPGDALEIWFAGALVESIDLAGVGPGGLQMVDVGLFAGQAGELQLRLTGPASDPAVVRLDDLRILSAGSIGTFSVSLSGGTVSAPQEVLLVAENLLPTVAPLGGVAFYVESNGVPGLQPGDDKLLKFDTTAADGWSTRVTAANLSYGVQRFYAATISDVIGPVATAEILLLPGAQPYHWSAEPLDVDRDGFITPLDALIIINALNEGTPADLGYPATIPSGFIDTTGDNFLAPLDALLVINYLNGVGGFSAGEGEPESDETNSIDVESKDLRELIEYLASDIDFRTSRKRRST
jgi:ELWxxDGT repeat protein